MGNDTAAATDLVTGGAGFIGSHLVPALLAAGRRVRVLDNLSTGRLENLEEVRADTEFTEGDIQSADDLARACRGVDTVYHLAAQVSPFDSVDRPMVNHGVNATGTLAVLVAAREAGARRVVLASSCAVYGNDPALPKQEDMAVCPESPYAATKLAGEHYVGVYARTLGLDGVSLRFFNVYGPRQAADSAYSGVISLFTECHRLGQTPTVFGDGGQTRDFVYVGDVAQALVLAGQAENPLAGAVFNVGTGRQTSLLDILAALERITGNRLPPHHGPTRTGDIRHSLADITQARIRLGFEPRTRLEDGLAELVRHG